MFNAWKNNRGIISVFTVLLDNLSPLKEESNKYCLRSHLLWKSMQIKAKCINRYLHTGTYYYLHRKRNGRELKWEGLIWAAYSTKLDRICVCVYVCVLAYSKAAVSFWEVKISCVSLKDVTWWHFKYQKLKRPSVSSTEVCTMVNILLEIHICQMLWLKGVFVYL